MGKSFELAHVGLNLENVEEAQSVAERLAALFQLSVRQGKKSVFAGSYFECMREPFLGEKGHIAMYTDNLAETVEELKDKGYSFREETAIHAEDGKLMNIYLTEEFGGFAIHILQKK
jgi:methylmalonyl-CoA/ethylmalonyl-CoA epimerase